MRVLCPDCKQPYPASEVDCQELGVSPHHPPTLYQPNGCAQCNHLGFRGRTGIYELVEVDEPMRVLVHDGSGEHKLEQHARTHSTNIRHDGMQRVLAGDTSLDEVLRVTRED